MLNTVLACLTVLNTSKYVWHFLSRNVNVEIQYFLSRNVEIQHFLSRNVKIWHFLSRNIKIQHFLSRKNGFRAVSKCALQAHSTFYPALLGAYLRLAVPYRAVLHPQPKGSNTQNWHPGQTMGHSHGWLGDTQGNRHSLNCRGWDTAASRPPNIYTLLQSPSVNPILRKFFTHFFKIHEIPI